MSPGVLGGILAGPLCACAALGAVVSGQTKPHDKLLTLRTLEVRSGKLQGALQVAGETAVRMLESEECQQVLSEFKDAQGRTLCGNLDAVGLKAPAYLQTIWFADGGPYARRCKNDGIVAVCQPGSHVVFVCAGEFAKAVFNDRRYGGAIIIHETLHTLGLAENPPSSKEITRRVLARCK
jgi:hypothetical protein